MNLATRCLSCGTVFRVGQDQLLASEGWVRCGRCDGVFNAAEELFDIDSGEPMHLALPAGPADSAAGNAAGRSEAASPAPGRLPADAPPPPAAAPQPAAAPWPAPPGDRQEPRFDPPHFDAPQVDALQSQPAPPAARRADFDEPLLRAPSRIADHDADDPIVITDHMPAPVPATQAQADFEPGLATPTPTPTPAPAHATAPWAGAAATAPHMSPVQAAPSFLRTADRAALWRHPAARAGLGAGVLLLALGMLLQMALLWRDELATHLPGTAPSLHALCRVAACTVQPLRRIQQLSVDSSGLNRVEGSSLYRLQLVLRNRADIAVMLPAVELSLTDPQGQLLARRVLQSAELGVEQAALQPGQALPIKLLLSTGERRADGYTLELFYP